MEVLDSVDEFLDFSSYIGDGGGGDDDDDGDNDKRGKPFPWLNSTCSSDPLSLDPLDMGDPKSNTSLSEFAEEELEWLSNKDAFPAIETFTGLPSFEDDISTDLKTAPMLEYSPSSSNSNNSNNSTTLLSSCDNLKIPVRPRSQSRSRPRQNLAGTSSQQFTWRKPVNKAPKVPKAVASAPTMGRICHHCGANQTPQWRAGPNGPKTLCNACGVRFKAGRLVPEYRPANSPSFCSGVHSNSHRKVLEMRKKKGMEDGLKAMDKRRSGSD